MAGHTAQEINGQFRMEEILEEESMSKMELDFDELVENVDEEDPDKNWTQYVTTGLNTQS